MEAHEIAETIHKHHEAEANAFPTHEGFRRVAAIYVGVIAMLLAIASLGSAEATKEMLNANIHASDTYAFYQAKYIRQTFYQLSASELELLAGAGSAVSSEDRAKAAELVRKYRDTAVRYESDPKTDDGKRELLEKARLWEQARDHAAKRLPNFEYGEALFQIAIVLGSVAIVALSRSLLGLSGVLSFCALLLTINGYLLVVPLGSN